MLEFRESASVELFHSGIRHGFGLFESVRVRDGRPRRLPWHLERLAAGAAFLGFEAPPEAAAVEGFARERLGLEACSAGVLRLYAFDGGLSLALSPGLPPPFPRAMAGIAGSLRRLAGSPGCRFKTMSYMDNILLAREAEERGLAEVIALNERGRLTDGGRTSFFLVKEGQLLTPPAVEGALPGIARRVLLESGLAREASLGPEDLPGMEAAFLTNALRLVTALEAFQGKGLDTDHPLIQAAAVLLQD
jgi:branched-chain amino acid aminotransferase